MSNNKEWILTWWDFCSLSTTKFVGNITRQPPQLSPQSKHVRSFLRWLMKSWRVWKAWIVTNNTAENFQNIFPFYSHFCSLNFLWYAKGLPYLTLIVLPPHGLSLFFSSALSSHTSFINLISCKLSNQNHRSLSMQTQKRVRVLSIYLLIFSFPSQNCELS